MTRLAMPLAPLAAAFAIGIALAPWASPRPAWALGVAAAALTALVLVAGSPVHATAPLLATVVTLGVLHALPSPLPADHVGRLPLPLAARVEGRLVASPVRWAPDRSRLLLDVERIDGVPRSGRISVTVYGPVPPLVESQRVAVERGHGSVHGDGDAA
ncbi:MAG TPA: hypothetical protein VIW03_10285, partial [Anaeromyxobacter sp.]